MSLCETPARQRRGRRNLVERQIGNVEWEEVPVLYVVLWSVLALAAFTGSLFVFWTRPFQFKDQGAGPDYRPSAGIAGALMTIAVLALVIALTV